MIWNPAKECMSRDEMHALQSKRLQKLVTYVYHNTPFYRNKMQAMDLSPEDIKSIDKICVITIPMDCKLHPSQRLFECTPRRELREIPPS